ncbi:aminopeptidase Q [Gracilinanus agilis]|uniref:aminopeptidase Q n=1 Tax=Gracilinanus agilis TaxID=191870 RepID=UPI001CFC538F|nr:aminopeptidase Q [Gracilinanus agilis]
MGVRSNSGFYLSRKLVTFMVILLSALLLTVAVLGSFYARCGHTSPQQWENPGAARLVQQQQIQKEKHVVQNSVTRAPETWTGTKRPIWSWDNSRPPTTRFWNHLSQSTSGPLDHWRLFTSGPWGHISSSTSEPPSTLEPWDDLTLSTSEPQDYPTSSTLDSRDNLTLSTSEPQDHTTPSTLEPRDNLTLSTSQPQLYPISEPWNYPRLPSDLVPLHYDLELWPSLRPDRIEKSKEFFSGRLNLTVRCISPTSRVLLHSLRLSYESVKVLGPLPDGLREDGEQRPVGQVAVNRLWEVQEMEYVVLELMETLEPGRRYVLQFNYSGLVNQEDKAGLFINLYYDQKKYRALIASQMEPTYARAVFPSFDEPAMKATFSITLVHHPVYAAISNMPVIGKSEREDTDGSKWTVTSFETTPLMSTYLTAFAVCDYNFVNRTERGKEVRIWAQKDAIANGYADYALTIAGPIFSLLEDLLNSSYPLPKMELIGFPMFDHQAMENWGLIMFDDFMLLQKKNDYPERKNIILSTVAHEIAHQWFGNIVTMKWWNDIWLNEGFASYFELELSKRLDPQIMKDQFFYDNYMTHVLSEDTALHLRTVSTVVKNYTHINEIKALFDKYVYLKGACMVRMLSKFLGENLFISGLQSYFKTFAFSNTVQDDLWNQFQMVVDNQSEVVLPASIKSIMDGWTHQSGYPIITLDVSTGKITQEPFYLAEDTNQKTSTYNKIWTVPIHWTKNGIVQPVAWIENSSKVFPEMQLSDSEHDWVVLNLNASGYYRVNYDQLGWKKLSLLLQKDPKAITTTDRLKLFDDAFMLSWNNYIELETALELTKYLAKEDDISVWSTVLKNLVIKEFVFDMDNYDIYPLLKNYLLKRFTLVWNIYSSRIRENISAINNDNTILQPLKIAFERICWLGLEDCLQLSKEIFKEWMNHSDSIKDIMCFGVAMGSDKEWDFLLSVYEKSTDIEERFSLLYAMSCSKEPWILHRYLKYALSTSLFTDDEKYVFQIVGLSEIGRFVVKDFLIKNWQPVKERLGLDFFSTLVNIIARGISTDAEVQELQQFFGNMQEDIERTALFNQLERRKNKNLEKAKRISRIANWLKENMND